MMLSCQAETQYRFRLRKARQEAGNKVNEWKCKGQDTMQLNMRQNCKEVVWENFLFFNTNDALYRVLIIFLAMEK